MRPVIISQQHIIETLDNLQEAGRRGKECVVLWLSKDGEDQLSVQQVFCPDQIAGADVFRIPPSSMQALMSILSSKGLMIAAQVHSHPYQAFHSGADDAWAIVRHINALSLVVPDFALKTNLMSFFSDVKIYQLASGNRWMELERREIDKWLRVL